MAEFDIDRFVSLSKAVDLSDIDWEEARRVGASDEEAAVLNYMQDTESHSVQYLRALLTGYMATDPEVTTFLACWVYEETHHGRALDRFLIEVGRPPARDRHDRVHGRPSFRDRASGWIAHAAGNTTPHFGAVHMCWGAANEFLAAVSYTQLARRSENKQLQKLLHRLAKDERRHFAFYHHQADKRLRAGGRIAQTLCATMLRRFWKPVGSGVADPRTLDMISSFLFSDKRGRQEVALFDQSVRELPGMGFFDLGEQWAEQCRLRFQAACPDDYARHRAFDASRDAESTPAGRRGAAAATENAV